MSAETMSNYLGGPPSVSQQGFRGPQGADYPSMSSGMGQSPGAFAQQGFAGVQNTFENTKQLDGAIAPSLNFFSTDDTNLMTPAQRSGQSQLRSMAADAGPGQALLGAFAQSQGINKGSLKKEDTEKRMLSIESNYFTPGDDLIGRSSDTTGRQPQLESSSNYYPQDAKYESIESQMRNSGSTLSTNTIPLMLGSFQHPDFAGADPSSVGIDMSGMSTAVQDATTRLLSAGQPMMSSSAPPDAFFQLNLAVNPRVFENAPLTQTVTKNGASRQDATGYIGYPQNVRIPLSDKSDSFSAPYAPYAQDMYLSDLLAKLDSGVVKPKTTAIHAGRHSGFGTTPAQQHLRDMHTFDPSRMVYQSMGNEWSGGKSQSNIMVDPSNPTPSNPMPKMPLPTGQMSDSIGDQ
jgi:hypothetical protein